MRKFLSVVIGIGLIIVAAVLLWIAYGPQSTEERTTGGVLYTQQEVAANAEAMEAVSDTTAGTMNVPVRPELSAAASADLQSVDTAEMAAAPMTVGEVESAPAAVASTALTTDIVLEMDTEVAVTPLTTSTSTTAGDGQGGMGTLDAAAYEQRVVELEWPGEFQVGRSGSLRIKLKMLDGGALQPVAEVDDNEVLATPILITDRYATHNAFVSATLSAPDFDVEWVSPVTQSLVKGGDAEWRWTLESDSAQSSVISLGLTISWDAKPGQTPGPQNVAIWGQAVQVDVNYVFGLITVPQASILGSVLGVMGVIAQFPLLEKSLEIFLDIFFGRDRRRKKRASSRRRTDNNRRDRRY